MVADTVSAAAPDVPPRPAARKRPPRAAPSGESARALTEARQSVADVVAARIDQVAEDEAAAVEAPVAGAPVDPAGADPAPEAPPGEVPADAEPADAPAARMGEADRAVEEPPVPGTVVAVRSDVAEVQAILQPTAEEAGRFAAAAVLDVLRASGWADADEAHRLRGEADRLRELLDLVVRDHRAREAATAGVESQQHHWLIPLLRAAHGVAFGSLGAKVALRTAVQDVPEHLLHAAGLRIDYGVEHTGDGYDER